MKIFTNRTGFRCIRVVFPEMVNADMRRQAKVINFGILLRMSAFGLAKETGRFPENSPGIY